jgi:serine/threonine-protein kinase
MTFVSGTRFRHYDILGLLGSGGMGEVYRARDTKLNREVAIKVLHETMVTDPDRFARFRREAQVLASLNHPNIAQIHGLEDVSIGDSNGNATGALIMELVDGPTLADRIAAGAIHPDEAFSIARQIAEALEVAHELGIVHRDLKPANIKIRGDGTVKVLDFGLAKAVDSAAVASREATASPTRSVHATQSGVILGTAAYMSPEQARGRPVDRRTDIWAFGCVLFEMLTRTRAFEATDTTDTIVAVLTKEPKWQRIPAHASGVRPLLARCFQKDPRRRLQAIGEARIQLEDLMSGDAPVSLPLRGAPGVRAKVTATAAAIVGIVALAWLLTQRPTQPSRSAARFEIVPPPSQALALLPDRNIAVSPDGQHIVYRATPAQLVLRSIASVEAQPLNGTVGARNPFFSPDSRWIGFFDGVALKKVPVVGGPAIFLSSSAIPRGASWGEDGRIVFATSDITKGLLRVSSDGGEPVVLTQPDVAKGERAHWQPTVLPQGRGVLFTIVGVNASEPTQVAALDAKTGEIKRLIRGGSHPEYLDSGHLVYASARNLMVVPFDLTRLELRGDAIPVVHDVHVMESSGAANYALSRNGTLVYIPAQSEPLGVLVWRDREGREFPVTVPPGHYSAPRVSPDGNHAAVVVRDQAQRVHIVDFARATMTRLTYGPGTDEQPVWTSDAAHLVFSSDREGSFNLYAQAADGTGTANRLTSSPDGQRPAWVAPDGTGIVGTEISPKTAGDIVWFPLNGLSSSVTSATKSNSNERRVEQLVQTPRIDFNPDVSPGGDYVAYQSTESGDEEVYVRPFPRVNDARWQVSPNGGTHPVWGRNGGELFYVDLSNVLTVVPVRRSGSGLTFGNRVKLFAVAVAGPYSPRPFDIGPDGRILVVKATGTIDQSQARIIAVLNWFDEVKAKLAER